MEFTFIEVLDPFCVFGVLGFWGLGASVLFVVLRFAVFQVSEFWCFWGLCGL